MLTIIMECRDQETEAAHTLNALVSGAVEGLVSDVLILDRGSSDGIQKLAEAAGCRYYEDWDMRDVLEAARGDWLFLIEPGARPQPGWIEEIFEYASVTRDPARFADSRTFKKPLLKRIGRKRRALENGVILTKRQAMAIVGRGFNLEKLAAGLKKRVLRSEIIPAWVTARETTLAD
ncbi:hypothetical protein SAMN05421890_1766 [Ensifer adhaerens]|nr:hypothetical protein SAMN05421890_1766 [Ensifer adhaerens]HZG27238.1 glycosyl transferase [Ensifer sp.]